MCYALLKALSADSRFTIRRAAEDGGFDIKWNVPGYWLVTAQRGQPGAWVEVFEFGCFVMEAIVLETGSTVW